MHRGIYNPTADAVWLAAFADRKTKTVLDVGIGTGGVSLCILAHNPNINITGIDVSDEMLAECAKNAELNARNIELVRADILTWRTGRTFDLVVSNPPYFNGTPAKHNAHHNADLYKWTRACMKRVKPRGYFHTIVDAVAMDKVIAALHDGKAGDIQIIPLFGAKNTAERVLIGARLGVGTGLRLFSGMSMNDERVLRDGLTIDAIFTMV